MEALECMNEARRWAVIRTCTNDRSGGYAVAAVAEIIVHTSKLRMHFANHARSRALLCVSLQQFQVVCSHLLAICERFAEVWHQSWLAWYLQVS